MHISRCWKVIYTLGMLSFSRHMYYYLHIYVSYYRYLCEYIYYKSLCINKNQTIFIHVPNLDQDNTAEKLALQLKCIIKKLLEQITQ